jgi:hypothetical protein
MPGVTSNLALCEGSSVESFDGRLLGLIGAVEEDRFLVKAKTRNDFWLPDVFVRSAEGSRVVLHLEADRLRRYAPVRHYGRGRVIALALMSASVLTALASIAA